MTYFVSQLYRVSHVKKQRSCNNIEVIFSLISCLKPALMWCEFYFSLGFWTLIFIWDPKFRFSFLNRGKLSLQVVVILIAFWWWRMEFRSHKMHQTGKILPLTLINSVRQQDPTDFCFRAFTSFMLSWFFNGILLAHQVVGPWKLHEGADRQWFSSA